MSFILAMRREKFASTPKWFDTFKGETGVNPNLE